MNRRLSPLPLLTPCLLAAALLAPAAAAAQAAHGHRMLQPADLEWTELPSLPPGARLAVLEGPMNEAGPFTARLRLPPHYRIPAHWHPAVERVSVLSGTFHMGIGEVLDVAKGMAVPPGGFVVMTARTPHFAYTTTEPVELQFHGTGPWGITYIDPADDPRRRQR